MSEYTWSELCIAACAEAWRGDGEILASGIGVIPRIAAALARLSFSPDLLITDGEALLRADAAPVGVPTATQNGHGPQPGVVEGWMPFRSVFDVLWAGRRHIMMGAAQLDRYGNQNISCIGDWHRPKVQLLGVRGAPGNSVNHPCSYWVPRHTARVFPERVDMVSGLGNDRAAELPEATRRYHQVRLIVTNLAVLDAAGPGGILRVVSLHPGVSLDTVQSCTGFPLAVAAPPAETPPPTPEQLRLIREVLDPTGLRHLEGLAP